MTLKPVTLLAHLRDGRVLRGESAITPSREISAQLKKLTLSPPSPKVNPRAAAAIQEADVIIVGPGNLYASILPNFLVREIREAFLASVAKKIYIANLFTQPGHTDRFSVSDFLEVLARYIGSDAFRYVIYNTGVISNAIMKAYANHIIGSLVLPPPHSDLKQGGRYLGAPLLSASPRSHPADPIARIRNPFLHDPARLARTIMKIL